MPTHRFASLCALTTLVLFSCNNKKNTGATSGNNNVATLQYDTVNVLPDESVNLNAYNAVYIENATQHFTASARRISVITAKKGLKLIIDPAVLETEDGTTVEGKIDVNIIELTNSMDLFKSSMATVSDGRLLSSGGSYFVDMECNGKKLKIKEGKGIQAVFPRLTEEDMELFYGEKPVDGTVNWKEAGKSLEKEYTAASSKTTGEYIMEPMPPTLKEAPSIANTFHLFNSMDAKVFFLNRVLTLKEWLNVMHNRGVNMVIDTLYYSWKGRGSNIIYSSEGKTEALYHGMQFRVIPAATWKTLSVQKDSFAEVSCMIKEANKKAYADYASAYEVYLKQYDQPSQDSIPDQLKKYYAPEIIGQLGWLNCDHFYKSRKNADINLDIPITLNNSIIEYFVIFKSFNGLARYREDLNDRSTITLKNLPVGAPVTVVAFAKNKGIMYQGKEDFIVEKNKKIAVGFNTISKDELNKIFRSNVKS